MNEDLMQFIWKNKLFDFKNLKSQKGETIEIIQHGHWNKDAGPDFLNAMIKIETTKWAGNIELHLKTSDWFRHKHQNNKAYDNLILHVVWEDDLKNEEESFEKLELKNYVNAELLSRYKRLNENSHEIACSNSINTVDRFLIDNWLERLLINRLERKTQEIEQILASTNNNWDETFYIYLAKYFGFRINNLPFEMLAKSTPVNTLRKNADSVFKLNAILFGQAGFLDSDLDDSYFQQLKKEYEFQKAKYNLKPIKMELWKFLRLRPYNFPTIRIAQFAGIIYKTNLSFSKLLACQNLSDFEAIVNTEINEYWNTHFTFKNVSKFSKKSIGAESQKVLFINVFVPLLFHYGKKQQLPDLIDKILTILKSIPSEKNHIVKQFNTLGVKSNDAFDAQAILELFNNYCTAKKCLICSIGNKILTQKEK